MSVSSPLARAGAHIVRERDRSLDSPVHSTRTAATLGLVLGVCFATCFATGLLSHLIQHPPGWFTWPARPAGLYRVTQGVHVATGLATVPILLAKLWSVFPNIFAWPPARSVASAVERLLLVPLVAGSVFMLFSGVASISHWYPWSFSFPVAHYWMAWVTIGGLVAHIGAKVGTTRRVLGRAGRARPEPAAAMGALTRRAFLGWTAVAAGAVTVTTAGQTAPVLRRLTLFAPRRPDIGPQGLPVNARAVGVTKERALDPDFRLRVVGAVARPVELSLDELRALPQRAARLPISCVEGWSASADWEGVPIAALLSLAGVPAGRVVEVEVRSVQPNSQYSHSFLNDGQARDSDTLLALRLNGDVLALDHGFPCRLIGPNRPGVQQTKWVTELVVS